MTCDDLRLGGTLATSGLSGGTSINSTALMVEDWSSILGSAGMNGSMVEVFGRQGGYAAGDFLGSVRFPTLNMRVTGFVPGSTGTQTDLQKQDNTDDFLALISEPSGNYLELDMADGTQRFIYVYNFSQALFRQPRADRTIAVPLESPYPFWKEGGQEEAQTISGADSMTVGGNREVYDAVLVFSGDGTFTHSTLGWTLEVTGSGGPVTVDLGARTVVEGGSPATNRIRRNNRKWGWFTTGSNAVTSDVSVDVTWRSSWS